ncbi:TPA: hypothetical protein MYL60_004763 [Klebsiella variicola subsp. variicola]|uniref:hypothetical protein n=1 Tax=Klebsiella variicola TaxID=244366 RepID=UPI002DBB273E|nr:hypothetical protein [Klebsiella variicola]MEB6354970.1 hypothetical protein [Klebsiella variicola]HCB0089748.1 hypothetical protein [Klebsiella variicola subsp. variicola]HCB0198590.1 hypothetical protein [Klebsiella variicola subsp. variicola]HCI6640474.1 hypothetical protein [Klebsiella variicola subsp. variicola]
MITKNFRLNALANQFSAAVYNHVAEANGGDWFEMMVNKKPIRVAIVGGYSGVRMLVDSYLLEALKGSYSQWEPLAIQLLTLYLDGDKPSELGFSIWQSMINDMADALENSGGHVNA